MARVTVKGSDLVVGLSIWEKVAALGGDVRVPLSAVRAVDVEPDPWAALRGARAPGTGLPGVIAYGKRRSSGGRDFAAVLGRRPAVRVDLDDSAPFGRLVISVSDAEATVADLRTATRR